MRRKFAALILLVILLALPAAGQKIGQALWAGPEQVLAGEVVTLRLTFPQGDFEEAAGTFQFDESQLGFQSMTAAEGWEVRLSKRSFTLTRKEASAQAPWLELSFRVTGLPVGTNIRVYANELTLRDQKETVSLGSAQWNMSVWEGLSGENHLTELWVEDGNILPEFHSDIDNYLVTVPADTKKPVVHAVPAPKAQLEIQSSHFTREGIAEVTVTVIAENGNRRQYQLTVYRELAESASKPLLTEPSGSQVSAGNPGTPGWVITAGIFGGASLLGAAAIWIERVVKKNR